METIIAEFHVSHDEATAAAAGKSNKRKNSKNLRAMETRKKMMFELEKGNTALISYQQAIGGSISHPSNPPVPRGRGRGRGVRRGRGRGRGAVSWMDESIEVSVSTVNSQEIDR